MAASQTNNNRLHHRRRLEVLLERSDLLAGDDSALLQMVFKDGIPLRRIADLRGVSPSTVSRRIRQLVRRLTGRRPALYQQARHGHNRLENRILRARYVQGLSQKTIARMYHVSLYRVRRTLRANRSSTDRPSRPAVAMHRKHKRSETIPRKRITKRRNPCTH